MLFKVGVGKSDLAALCRSNKGDIGKGSMDIPGFFVMGWCFFRKQAG